MVVIQRAYYITDEQYRELKILAVENDTDTSSLVKSIRPIFNKRLANG